MWPLKSEETERGCPRLKASSSQLAGNQHTLAQTHVKRVSNKQLYQEFQNKEALAPCVAAHPWLTAHACTSSRVHEHDAPQHTERCRCGKRARTSCVQSTITSQQSDGEPPSPAGRSCTVHSFLPVGGGGEDNHSLFD